MKKRIINKNFAFKIKTFINLIFIKLWILCIIGLDFYLLTFWLKKYVFISFSIIFYLLNYKMLIIWLFWNSFNKKQCSNFMSFFLFLKLLKFMEIKLFFLWILFKIYFRMIKKVNENINLSTKYKNNRIVSF
jgi:hypothetical protein